jgi:hypothetical protein
VNHTAVIGQQLSRLVADMAGGITEAVIQSNVRSYLTALSIDSIHFANGAVLAGDRIARAKQVAKLKRGGMIPGAADLILFDRRVRRIAFFEVKREGEYQSPKQKEFEALATGVWGWPYAVVRSIDDAKEALNQWGWRP